ncbi:hypothetical protein GCM10009574_080200 [Streptomyces asiaticus]|uniref:Uncharacterized protein n=2 Tax=Streptomyces rhizosphaericus TaxID=114699 RepID=A0ABN1QH61_9ACTN
MWPLLTGCYNLGWDTERALEGAGKARHFDFIAMGRARCWHTIASRAHRNPRRDSFARGSAARLVSWRHTCPQPAHR